ncbi:caspase recruitment domain-containing protein 11-like isoform X2 [Lytechinus variegatus]|nr:caspase recruitment domain-containing protein 11-like isoform X2 [Lytechinus variegatus]XP_041473375.1 caspase recruitment domain-containing protein 11-like isoform X2 [Lytechinus variegatus]
MDELSSKSIGMEKIPPLSASELEELLKSNWSKLVKNLEVERILPSFQDAYLLDVTDRERITNASRYPTSVERAGIFLDTLSRRGDKAVKLLFSQVEEHYPELYKEITGREPKITRQRLKTIMGQRAFLTPALTLTILTQLAEMLEVKEKQEKELERTKKDVEVQRLDIEKLTHTRNVLQRKNKALRVKKEERDKMEAELAQRTTMLKDVQNKLLKFQREADKAKHHARMATFKNFHLEYELRETQNRRNIERRQTRNLQRSVKNHEKLLSEHNITYTFDPKKVEELQRELEKIDDFRRSVAVSDEVCEISERVKSQLAEVRQTNKGLNLKVRRKQEENERLRGEIDLLKQERTMMRETMKMNRLHLEMSQKELEIVSQERAKLNQAYEEVLKDLSQSFLNTTSLQRSVNKLRLDYADLSERVINNNDGSMDTSGVFTHGDADDELGDDDDDVLLDALLDSASSGVDEKIVPMPRPRVTRMVSNTSRGCKLEQMKTLSESFDKASSASSPSRTMTSSSSTTTGDDSASASLKIGRISRFPSYSFLGSSDDDGDDEDDYDEDMARSKSRLEEEFEVVDQPFSMRSRPATRHVRAMQDRRRSRSLSRLEDYESMEFLNSPGCYRYAQPGSKDSPPAKALSRESSGKGQRSINRVESWLLVSNPKASVPKLRVPPMQAEENAQSPGPDPEGCMQECIQPSEQWLGPPLEPIKQEEPLLSKRIKNLSGFLVMNRGSYRFGVHRKGGQKVVKHKEKPG